jgi:hypothetical protein
MEHLSRMPQQTNICLLSINKSYSLFSTQQCLTHKRDCGRCRTRTCKRITRTAVFETAALPIMLTFHREQDGNRTHVELVLQTNPAASIGYLLLCSPCGIRTHTVLFLKQAPPSVGLKGSIDITIPLRAGCSLCEGRASPQFQAQRTKNKKPFKC